MVTDSDLLISLKEDDEHAFRAIYQRYWYKLYAVAKRKIHTVEDAEEIVQDIFVDLWDRRTTVQIVELDRFLYSAVKYKVLNYIKAQIVRQNYQTNTLAAKKDIDSTTEEVLAFNDLSEAVKEGLEGLSVKTREIFQLARIEGHSIREVALRLHIPERTVEYHLAQSTRSLRLFLRDFVVYTIFLLLALAALR